MLFSWKVTPSSRIIWTLESTAGAMDHINKPVVDTTVSSCFRVVLDWEWRCCLWGLMCPKTKQRWPHANHPLYFKGIVRGIQTTEKREDLLSYHPPINQTCSFDWLPFKCPEALLKTWKISEPGRFWELHKYLLSAQWQGCREISILISYWWECKLIQSLEKLIC